jgi:MYXO-CTERM domain-containing protein
MAIQFDLQALDLASLNGIIQKSGIQSIFANQAQLGIVALAALLGALWIRRRRRGSGIHLLYPAKLADPS